MTVCVCVSENECGFDRRRAGGMGLMYDVTGDAVDGGSNTRHHVMVAQNRNLIEYFARLGQSHDEGEYINLDYVRTILKNGANINCTDKYGQSVFHEVHSHHRVRLYRSMHVCLKVAAVAEATRAHWGTCSLLFNFTQYSCAMVII